MLNLLKIFKSKLFFFVVVVAFFLSYLNLNLSHKVAKWLKHYFVIPLEFVSTDFPNILIASDDYLGR